MKYALIGSGKTGQAILDSLPEDHIAAVFNSRNPIDRDILNQADVGIVFVPGRAMEEIIPLLLEARTPLVIGTTGFAWPQYLHEKLRDLGVAWILGQNFSLGLNIMRYYVQRLEYSLNRLKPGQLRLGLSETHHIHKKDAPSGTALYLAHVLNFPAQDIVSHREGDAKGTHTVSLNWPKDRIIMTHEALDRSTFAEGVLLACQQILNLPAGLHSFEDLADTMIENSQKG